MEKFFLDREDTALLIVDIQDKLASVMAARDSVVNNCLHLIELSKLLNLPVIVTEQYPKGPGQTVEEIRNALSEYRPVEKLSFDCCSETPFFGGLKKLGKKKLILTGMETHICILQSCVSLLRNDFAVHVVSDAVCSRVKENWSTALEFMRDAGAAVTCTETVLFQLLKVAGTKEFKAISQRIR
jgi:isochorismate hydrolase